MTSDAACVEANVDYGNASGYLVRLDVESLEKEIWRGTQQSRPSSDPPANGAMSLPIQRVRANLWRPPAFVGRGLPGWTRGDVRLIDFIDHHVSRLVRDGGSVSADPGDTGESAQLREMFRVVDLVEEGFFVMLDVHSDEIAVGHGCGPVSASGCHRITSRGHLGKVRLPTAP